MEKIYTFTKAGLIKKLTITGSVLFVLLGIFSFFQGPLANYIDDFEVDNSYLFKSDIFIGILLIISGIICFVAIKKWPSKFHIILKIVGIFYIIFGLLAVGHGNSNYLKLFSFISTDIISGILFMVIGTIVTLVGFWAKGDSLITLEIKKESEKV